MDKRKCSTLVAHLKAVPDPRAARGVRYPWWVLLTLLAAGLLAGETSCRGIAQWVREHQRVLRRYLPLRRGIPSESALQRAWRRVDPVALQAAATAWVMQGQAAPRAVAVDGKAVRGSGKHGCPVHLLAAVDHDRAVVLAQRQVDQKTNEIPVAPQLLGDLELAGTVVTVDAMHCQRRLASEIRRRDGHYLMQVKENQPDLWEDLRYHFQSPREGRHPLSIQSGATVNGGHDRTEGRLLESSEELNGVLEWPGLGQVLHRVCRRKVKGKVSEEHHYYVTSLTAEGASPAELERLCRGHWTIENRVHYVRDVTYGEDASDARAGSTPEARAILLNAVMALLRDDGWALLTDAKRHYRAHPAEALRRLGLR
jgi:predicted transposase YbfD/YdcC